MDVGFHKENVKFFKHFGISEESGIPSKKIALVLQQNFKDNQNAQQSFILCSNLLARLFFNIDLIIPEGTMTSKTIDENGNPLSDYVLSEMKMIFEPGNFNTLHTLSGISDYDGVLVIGCRENDNELLVSVISDGWNIYINNENAVSENYNAIGACAASCMGAAELFKIVVKPVGSKLCNQLSYSLLNYNSVLPEENPELPTTIDIGHVTLVGVGAIGSGVIYTLKCFSNIVGNLAVVDKDNYSDTNLNRYIIANEKTLGKYKVDNAKQLLSKYSGLKVYKNRAIYKDFIKKKVHIDTLITAVDKRITRFNVQSDIPRLIIDAATTDSLIDLARVDFGNGGACLGCLYLPERKDEQIYSAISEFTGINIERVRYLYDSNEGVNDDDIAIISKKLGKDEMQYIGSPIDSIYAHEFCGSGKIPSNVAPNKDIIAPVSFISALAGVLIVCELVKDRYFPQYKINNHLLIDTLKIPNPKLHTFKKSNPRCPYCNDKVFLETFKEKWGLIPDYFRGE